MGKYVQVSISVFESTDEACQQISLPLVIEEHVDSWQWATPFAAKVGSAVEAAMNDKICKILGLKEDDDEQR